MKANPGKFNKKGKTTSRFATIWIDSNSGDVKLRTPYNKTFIDELKNIIPYQNRRWVADEKLWSVDIHFMEKALALCEKYFKVETVPTENIVIEEKEDCYSIFIKYLSMKSLKRIWKIVISELHPDISGNNDLFVKVKDAYEEIIKIKENL